MGPRLFSRGNPGAGTTGQVTDVRLQWGRGFSAAETRCRAITSRWSRARFNGAAAFQPRKPQPADQYPQGAWRGFNGAAAFQPRKLFYSSYKPRPRHDCFNGAAAFQPRKRHPSANSWHSGTLELQWGRGFSAAETRSIAESWSHSFRRFNGAAAFQPRKLPSPPSSCQSLRGFNGAAAFQPRKLGATAVHPCLQNRLQWGRGFSAAETNYRVGVAVQNALLQWGRGFSAAETRRSGPHWQSLPGFNGAAAFQPRKLCPD